MRLWFKGKCKGNGGKGSRVIERSAVEVREEMYAIFIVTLWFMIAGVSIYTLMAR